MMQVLECTTQKQLEQMIDMASRHPAPEYDGPFSEYETALRSVFGKPEFRAWIAYEDELPIGYVSAFRIRKLRNEVSVFDIYLERGHRGERKLIGLTDEVKNWAVQDHALRVTWTTRHQYERWQRVLGANLAQYQTVEWIVPKEV